METASTGARGELVAGLVVDDGDGHYFAIAWGELLRFRVPEPHRAAVAALVHGAEAIADEFEVLGYVGGGPTPSENLLLDEAMTDPAPGRGRWAARRLSAWALLR